VVIALAVEREGLPAGGDREARRAGERAQVAHRLAGRRRGQPGAQRLGGQAGDVQDLIGGPLGRGRDAPAGAQAHDREDGPDQGGQQHEHRGRRRQVSAHAGIVSQPAGGRLGPVSKWGSVRGVAQVLAGAAPGAAGYRGCIRP
jgi:hypothetical protein